MKNFKILKSREEYNDLISQNHYPDSKVIEILPHSFIYLLPIFLVFFAEALSRKFQISFHPYISQ